MAESPESPLSATVAELLLERPERMRLFERLGIDYCCGGDRPIADACRERGLDPATFATLLDALDQTEADDRAEDWAGAPIGDLCDHIVESHHAYLRTELPRLAELAAKAARAHGEDVPELHDVQEVLGRLRSELEEHLDDEERTLFPACRRLAAGESGDGVGSLDDLRAEHAAAGDLLVALRERTGGFDEAGARCNTHRALLMGLAELEHDLHEHIHEENNILFPRVLALAQP